MLIQDANVSSHEFEQRSDVPVSVVRAPRYGRFMLVGALVGALAAVLLTVCFPENGLFTGGQVLGFLALVCGPVGVGLGGVLALLADRVARRRARVGVAERVVHHEASLEPDIDSDSSQ